MHLSALPWLEEIVRDVRYGLRALRRSPVLSLATIVTFTLGIGVNSGVFTILNGTLLRARVEKDPDSFAHVSAQYAGGVGRAVLDWGISTDDFRAYQAGVRSMDHLAAWSIGRSTVGPDDPTRTLVMPVTCNFFSLYGLERPRLGRLFRPADCERPGASPVVVLSEALWRSRFAADPDIVGTVLLLNHQPFTIVGITPGGFAGQLRGPGVWVPYTMQAPFFGGQDFFRDSSVRWLTLEGRLRSGHTRMTAQADLAVIARQQDRLSPGRITTIFVTNGSFVQEPAQRAQMLWIGPLILGAVMLVLLLACTNVTMLFLSRAVARQREIGIRLALGAGRTRLLRMLLTETLMLAFVSGGLSAWIAGLVPALMHKLIPGMPHYPLEPDRLVFAYLAGITLIAGTIAGLAPAAESLKADLTGFLNGPGFFGSSRGRAGGWLVGSQVAMSLVLLAGAGLFMRAEFTIFRADVGFDTRQVLTVAATPPRSSSTAASSFSRMLEQRLRALPAIRSVAVTSAPPFSSEDGRGPVEEVRLPGQARGAGLKAAVNTVSPPFFRTLGIDIVHGRAFRDDDSPRTGAASPIVISEALARTLWPAADPLGQLALDADGDPLEVVGVARDVISQRFGAVDGPSFYRVRDPRSHGGLLLVRFDGDPAPAQLAVRTLIRDMDPEIRPRIDTLQSVIDTFAGMFWKLADIVLVLGAVAIGLASVGIYGVIAFSMSRRTHEIGVRMALGATRMDIVRSAIASGVRPVIFGLFAGLLLSIIGAVALQQAFRATPIGFNVRDPIAYLGVVLLLGVIALAAMLGPALRAGFSDPLHALRRD